MHQLSAQFKPPRIGQRIGDGILFVKPHLRGTNEIVVLIFRFGQRGQFRRFLCCGNAMIGDFLLGKELPAAQTILGDDGILLERLTKNRVRIFQHGAVAFRAAHGGRGSHAT